MIPRRILIAALLAPYAFAQQAQAPVVEIDRPLQLPALIVGDLGAALTAPADWSGEDWQKLSLGALAVVAVSLALDRPVARAVDRLDRHSYDSWGKKLDTLGGAGTVAIVGGAYVTGLLADQPRLREFGSDAALSMLVAQLCVTIPTKFLVGRSRPYDEQGPYHFKPMHGGLSFPSGHATQVFTLAAVISEYADNPWASAAAYGGATLVGLSRLEQRAHFVSDVVAGAAIGTLSAKAVMLRHRKLRTNPKSHLEISWSPLWTGQTAGVSLAMKF